MCGIAGIYNIDKTPLSIDMLKQMTDDVKHRGPDGGDTWVHQNQHIGFGHRRLSILDLSDEARQPMQFASGRYTITYNGEIFNFIELKKQLETKGYTFRSTSDTEVVMAAYDFWGKDCLNKFNGMWAFALWDEKEHELFLARDHFGIKPLYFSYSPGKQFIFGSETNQFKRVSKRQIDDHLLQNSILNPLNLEGYGMTIFKGIKSILPGHFISIKNNDLQHKCWWNTLDYPIQIPNDYQEQVDVFKDLFFDSCKLRLRSDVPIASALSGGVDSSSVFCSLHTMSTNSLIHGERIPASWQKAFVATFKNTSQDETEYATAAVNKVNGSAIYVEQNFDDLAEDILTYTKMLDAIYTTPINIIGQVYSSMKKNGITVSMDGHGVDEMMYGYPGIQIDAAREAMQRGNIDYCRDLISTYVNLYPPHQRQQVRKKLEVELFKSNKAHDIKLKISKLNRRIQNRIWPKEPWIGSSYHAIPHPETLINPTLNSNAENKLFVQFHQTWLPTILRNFDKASMYSGIEIRMPFMDHRLVSYVFNLPIESKIGNGFTKKILRDSMTGILPNVIRDRTVKVGFAAPLKEWSREKLKYFIGEIVNSPNFKSYEYWNAKSIIKAVDSYYKKDSDIDIDKLWKIINAYIVLENN
jgi:asparagine synthase (glutamine-hydrolysing)